MNYTKLTDSQLVNSSCQGKQECFEEIVMRYQQRMFAYVYRLVGNKEDSLDIVQEVFIKVYKNLKSFNTEKEFSPWIYRIAHNESVNYLKKNRKFYTESIEDNDDVRNILKSKENINEDAEAKELQVFVRSALEKLPLKYQKVIELKYFQQKSYQEMSKILKKPMNSVGTLLNRAKKLLYQHLKYESIPK